ncbi:MAG: hypothetical protein IJO52_11915 [Clostridia bacterium]|nr:hypothetical protein [Clostridia bacterium]
MNITKIVVLSVAAIVLLYSAAVLFDLYDYVEVLREKFADGVRYALEKLPPNPATPAVRKAEFDFTLKYSVDGELKEVSDTLVCEYAGTICVFSPLPSKSRSWKEYLKNDNNNELFPQYQRDEEIKKGKYYPICLENIDEYKVLLFVEIAEKFMGEYKVTDDLWYIKVYNTETKKYKNSDEFLKEHNIEIIEWTCDEPIENKFILGPVERFLYFDWDGIEDK